MRNKLKISHVNCLALFILALPSMAQQINNATGNFDIKPAVHSVSNSTKTSNNAVTATGVCKAKNTFWGIESVSKQIDELRINNGVVELTGNTIPNYSAPGFNLAIANNLNGGSLSPTLYTNNFTNYLFWEGDTNWLQAPAAPVQLYNTGAYKNNFYGLTYTASTESIVKFDGTNYSPIFSTSKGVGCSDLAVDSSGNVYFISSPAQSFVSDSLYVISPNGQIINQYSFVLSSIHVYGSFILDGKLYLGLGSGHPDFPNTILPIDINGNAASAGTPMAMPGTLELSDDLTSCVVNPVEVLVSDSSSLEYPTVFTPNNDGINDLFLPFEKNIVELNCKIFNRWGQSVAELTEINMPWDGHTVSGIAVPPGVYYYIAKGSGKDEKQYELHGCVTLLR